MAQLASSWRLLSKSATATVQTLRAGRSCGRTPASAGTSGWVADHVDVLRSGGPLLHFLARFEDGAVASVDAHGAEAGAVLDAAGVALFPDLLELRAFAGHAFVRVQQPLAFLFTLVYGDSLLCAFVLLGGAVRFIKDGWETQK